MLIVNAMNPFLAAGPPSPQKAASKKYHVNNYLIIINKYKLFSYNTKQKHFFLI